MSRMYKKKTIKFVMPVVVQYETQNDLKEAIKCVKRNLHIEYYSCGNVNYDLMNKKPKLLNGEGTCQQR